MVIDSHCHVFRYPDHFSEEMADIYMVAWTETPLFHGSVKDWKVKNLNVDEKELISSMDEAGVDKAFVMGHVWKPYKCETPLEWVASIVHKYPDRLIGFHVADPLGGLKEVENIDRAVNELGFKGLKLFPAYNHISLNDQRMYPLFEKAQKMGIPVLIHTGWTHVPKARMEWQNPVLIDDIANDFPDLRIIMGHSGFQWIYEALMVMKKHKKVYGDFAFWLDWTIQFTAQVMTLAKSLGLMTRVLWGSDYPGITQKPELERYRRLIEYTKKHEFEPEITEEDLKLFFGENARKLVKI